MATKDIPRRFKTGCGRGKTQSVIGALTGAGIQTVFSGVSAHERKGEHEQQLCVPEEGMGDLEGTDAENLALPQPFARSVPELLQVGARVRDPRRYSEVQIAKPQRQARGHAQAREMGFCPDVGNLQLRGVQIAVDLFPYALHLNHEA